MKVAVIGAAGWVGRAVLENFAGRHQVRAFDTNPEAWEAYRRLDGGWEGVKVYGDIADFGAVDSALEGMGLPQAMERKVTLRGVVLPSPIERSERLWRRVTPTSATLIHSHPRVLCENRSSNSTPSTC